jgi:peptide/nickel transport system permease protein
MRTYILKRLLQIIPTILMITFVVFVMMRSIPGDPVVALLGDAYTEENAIKARHEYGLDKPVMVQYFIWLGKLAQGDWGSSILSGRPVLKDVMLRLPVTLELIVLSMAVALAIAIPAAIIGALRQNTWADYTATSVAMIGVSIPEFFLGVLLLLVFSVGLGGMLPSSGWVYLPGTCQTVVCAAGLWGNTQHVLMPAVALGVGRAALLTRLLRASMLEVIRTEYVTTARAKGLAERPVILKHALKNALIPTVTVMGLQVGFLIGGAIVVETLFAMPGLGTFGIDAIIARDYQQVQGFALITALAFVFINLQAAHRIPPHRRGKYPGGRASELGGRLESQGRAVGVAVCHGIATAPKKHDSPDRCRHRRPTAARVDLRGRARAAEPDRQRPEPYLRAAEP